MNQESLETLARAGVVWVQPGIESLSDEVLGLMGKGVSALLNLRVMRNCRELGMGVIWSILYGFPGEPAAVYEDMARLVPVIEHLHPPVSCGRIRLDRFSPNFERAAEMGFEGTVPAPAYGAIYNVPQDELHDLAYFFEGSSPSAASEDNLVSLRSAIAEWRSRWFSEAATPQLTLVRVGAGGLVQDTRSIATARLNYLQPAELALIDAMRDPCDHTSVFAKLSAEFAPQVLANALDRLVRQRFVIRYRGKNLSLIVDSDRSVFDVDDRADTPTGYLAKSATNRQTEGADLDRHVDRGKPLVHATYATPPVGEMLEDRP